MRKVRTTFQNFNLMLSRWRYQLIHQLESSFYQNEPNNSAKNNNLALFILGSISSVLRFIASIGQYCFDKDFLLTMLLSVALACSIKSFMVISNEIDEDQVDYYDDNHIYDEPYPGQNQVPNPDLTQQNLPESAVKWQEVTLEIQQKNNDVR